MGEVNQNQHLLLFYHVAHGGFSVTLLYETKVQLHNQCFHLKKVNDLIYESAERMMSGVKIKVLKKNCYNIYL